MATEFWFQCLSTLLWSFSIVTVPFCRHRFALLSLSLFLSFPSCLFLFFSSIHPFFEESKLEAKNSLKKYGTKRFQTIRSVKQLQSAVFVLSGEVRDMENDREERVQRCPPNPCHTPCGELTARLHSGTDDTRPGMTLPPLHDPCLCWAPSLTVH